jgi:hypothetical protein
LEKLKKSKQVQSYEQLKNLGIAMEKVCMIPYLLKYKSDLVSEVTLLHSLQENACKNVFKSVCEYKDDIPFFR